jgi:hypothetical protein
MFSCALQIDIDFLHIHEDKVRQSFHVLHWLSWTLAAMSPTCSIIPPCRNSRTAFFAFSQVWDKTVYDSGVLPLESKCIQF